MRVVILGAAGQLGMETVRTLSARGHAVCAAVRRPPVPAFGGSVEVRLADAPSKADLSAAIGGVDALVNLIGGGTLPKMMLPLRRVRSRWLLPRKLASIARSRCPREWWLWTGALQVRFAPTHFPTHSG